MSSSLCFLCHSTVNSETSDDIRDKFKEVVGMHLSPHLCHVCCHMVRKLYHFRATCLKRSLEYPVLFRERGTLNLQKYHLESVALCPEEECQPPEFPMTNFYMNSKLFHLKMKHSHKDNAHIDESSTGHNQYVDLEQNEHISNIETQPSYYNDELVNDITIKGTKFQDTWQHSGKGNMCVSDKSIEQNWYANLEHNKKDTEAESKYFNDDKSIERNQYVELEHNKKDTDGEPNYFNGEQVNDTDNRGDEIQGSCYESDNDGHYYGESTNGSDEESRVSPDFTGETETNIESRDMNKVTDMLEQLETQEDTTTQEEPHSTPKKKPKKKSFERIVLTFQEQKAVLKAQRKEQKYLEAAYKCHSCALGFLFQDTYQSHMVRHEESNGQFKCNVCGLRFATQNARAMHVNLHAEIYKCNRCSAEVKRPHRIRHSRDCWRVVDTASCHLCGKEFRDANCLQQHLRRFHTAKSSNRVYPCSVCGKTYPDPGVLRTHIIKHISGRFSCPECPASFTSPYTLSRHRRRHAPDAGRAQTPVAFHCAACGTSYESKKSLDAHLRNTLRHQQRSLECALCPRKFPTAHALRRHAASHAPAPRDCALCGARCRSQAALLRHTRAHSARPSVIVCHICGKGFKCKSKLSRHVREVCEKSKIEEELATFYEQESVLEQIQAVVGT